MARKRYYRGSEGPFLFDDEDTYEDGVKQTGFRTDSEIKATKTISTDLSSDKRLMFSNQDKEADEVHDLSVWLSGGENTTVVDAGDGTAKVEGITNEQLQDKVAALLSGGENTDVVYDDTAPSLEVVGVTDEQLQDKVSAFLGGGENTDVAYDDTNNALTVTGVTDEQLEDKVAGLLQGGSNVTVSYDDANNILEAEMDKAPAVTKLNQTISDPPTQSEVQAISDKVDELIGSLRNNVLNS